MISQIPLSPFHVDNSQILLCSMTHAHPIYNDEIQLHGQNLPSSENQKVVRTQSKS